MVFIELCPISICNRFKLTPRSSIWVAKEWRNKSKRLDFLRHSTASHLLEAGVDINTIRAWLDHISVNTTNVYAEINIQMKANALKTCEIESKGKYQKHWKSNKKLMDFLTNLWSFKIYVGNGAWINSKYEMFKISCQHKFDANITFLNLSPLRKEDYLRKWETLCFRYGYWCDYWFKKGYQQGWHH